MTRMTAESFAAMRDAESAEELNTNEEISNEEVDTEDSKEQPEVDTEATEVEEGTDDESTGEPEEDALDSDEESEESASDEEETDTEEDDVLYEIGEIQISGSKLKSLIELDKVKEKNESQEADYTKKSQLNAEIKKILSERESEVAIREKFVESIMSKSIKTPEELAELGEEYGFDAYKEAKEENDANIAKLEEIRKNNNEQVNNITPEEQALENQKIIELFPNWVDEKGNITETYQKDVKDMTAHAKEIGFSEEDINKKLTGHLMVRLVSDSKKLKELLESNSKVEKKIAKAIVVSKGSKKSSKSNYQQKLDKAQKAYNMNATADTWAALQDVKDSKTN